MKILPHSGQEMQNNKWGPHVVSHVIPKPIGIRTNFHKNSMWETCSDNMCFLSTRIPQMYDHKVRIYIFFLLESKPISNKENNTIFIEGVHKENCTTRWPQTRIGTRTRARKPKHGFTSIWIGTEQGLKFAS